MHQYKGSRVPKSSMPPLTRWVLLAMLFSGVLSGALRAQQDVALNSDGKTAVSEAEFLTNLRQVTRGFAKAGEGYFSPDARHIVYQAISVDYPFYQIYTQPLEPAGDSSAEESRPRRISTGRGRTTCSYFSPDGKRILFASSHLDPDISQTEEAARRQLEEDRRTGRRRRYQWVFDPHMEIFEADRKGNLLRRLTNTAGYDAECAYSPDGKQIVFCSDRDGDPDIYVMNVDGTNVRQITDQPGYDGGPFFSPDGHSIVYRSDRLREDHLQVHVISLDGKHDVALTAGESVNWGPYWHPREPYVIWAGADHSRPGVRPNYDLWIMRLQWDGAKPRAGQTWRVTSHPSADVLPVFSPDGNRLMWTSNRTSDGSSQLWIADFRLP